jgi:hypothetical protein
MAGTTSAGGGSAAGGAAVTVTVGTALYDEGPVCATAG